MFDLLNFLKTSFVKTQSFTSFVSDDLHQHLTIPIPDSLRKDFDLHVESCRVGLRKPNPRIYELTAQKLGLLPEECVYVDELARHCRGAEIAGMKSVKVRGFESGELG